MRRLISVLSAVSTLAIANSCWAHHDAEELGHHWELSAYTNEMHLQIFLMAAIVAAIGAWSWMARLRKRRSAQR